MNATVSRWGNSLGLRIPRGYLEALKLQERSQVDVQVEDGALVVRPIARRKSYDLETLVNGITSENVHVEVSTGANVGNEI